MRRNAKSQAFTLVELLVVIGIIAILIAVLIPTLAHARKSAQELKSESNLRQMLIGYAMYSEENQGWVPFGYLPATFMGSPTVVTDPQTGLDFGAPVSERY